MSKGSGTFGCLCSVILVRKVLCILLNIVLFACLGAGFGACALPASAAEVSEYGNPLIPVMVKGTTVMAEVVSSPGKLYLGLAHRPTLPPGRGMLFVLPAEEIQEFCMRGMRFALDLIWIREGRVVGWEKNVAPDDPRTLVSPVPVKYVLEVPAGFCDRHHIAVYDRVSFRWPAR